MTDKRTKKCMDRQTVTQTNRQYKYNKCIDKNRDKTVFFQALVENVATKLSGGHHQLAGAHQAQQAAPKVMFFLYDFKTD